MTLALYKPVFRGCARWNHSPAVSVGYLHLVHVSMTPAEPNRDRIDLVQNENESAMVCKSLHRMRAGYAFRIRVNFALRDILKYLPL